jgi:hypothetical protein
MNGVVIGLYIVDMAPKEEPGFGQAGDGDADVMEGKHFLDPEAALAIEKIAIAQAQTEMHDGCGPVARQEHDQPDAQEEDDLNQPEEEVYPGQEQQIPACQHQDEYVKGNEQLTPEIEGRGFLSVDMAKRMGQDKKGRGSV